MNGKSKRVPLLQRMPTGLPWAAVVVVIVASVVYAAHENQLRADKIINQLSSELAVAKAELQLALNELETANAKLEDSVSMSENAIVADLFAPLVIREEGPLIERSGTGDYAVSCADLPVGIGFSPKLVFPSLMYREASEPYIMYGLRMDFARPLKSSGRYEKVEDHTFVRKDVLDSWIAITSRSGDYMDRFAYQYCKSMEMGQ